MELERLDQVRAFGVCQLLFTKVRLITNRRHCNAEARRTEWITITRHPVPVSTTCQSQEFICKRAYADSWLKLCELVGPGLETKRIHKGAMHFMLDMESGHHSVGGLIQFY